MHHDSVFGRGKLFFENNFSGFENIDRRLLSSRRSLQHKSTGDLPHWTHFQSLHIIKLYQPAWQARPCWRSCCSCWRSCSRRQRLWLRGMLRTHISAQATASVRDRKKRRPAQLSCLYYLRSLCCDVFARQSELSALSSSARCWGRAAATK